MTFFLVSLIVSLFVTLLVIRSSERHQHLSADHDLDGPQKFHSLAVPRIGGVGVFMALVAGASQVLVLAPVGVEAPARPEPAPEIKPARTGGRR